MSDLGSHSSRVKVNDVPTVSDDNIVFNTALKEGQQGIILSAKIIINVLWLRST